MRRLLPLAALVAGLLSASALASDIPLGTITSSGSSTTNLSTASPFQLTARARVSVQCTAAAYVATGDAGGTVTATSANVLVAAGQLYDIPLYDQKGVATFMAIAILPVSGSASCNVFLSVP